MWKFFIIFQEKMLTEKIYTVMSNVKIVSYKFVPVCRIALLLPSVTYKCDYEIQDQFFRMKYFKISSFAVSQVTTSGKRRP